MSDQYEDDEEDGVEFVGHYDRFFKDMSDPAIKREVNEKEAEIIEKIDAVKQHQLKTLLEREKFALSNEGMTHQDLIQSFSGKAENKASRKKEETEIVVSEFVRKIFETTLAKDRPLVDYLRFHVIQDYTNQNEYKTLCFIGVRSINLLSPIACIKEEQWIKGVKKNYDLYTKPLSVSPRSRYDAIQGLLSKDIIFKKNFHDKKGIFYFLNTANGKKIYEMVKAGKLNRDDLERINELLKKGFLHSLDPELVEKFLQYRSAKLADLSSENHYKDQHYFQVEPATSADQKEDQSKTGKEPQNSLPIDHPKESPKVTSLDPDLDPTSGKNPFADFSEGDQLEFLESRLSSWKKNQADLNYLIENFSLFKVFSKTIELEEKDQTKQIDPIISFYPYLEKALKNDKQKAESKKSRAAANSKKTTAKQKEPENEEKKPDFISLFQIYFSGLTEETLKSDFNILTKNFLERLKVSCNVGSKDFIIESIPKIKEFITGKQLHLLLLNSDLAHEEVENIMKFLSEN